MNPVDELLAHEHIWTTDDIGVNAISGVLAESKASFMKQLEMKAFDNLPQIPRANIRKIKTSDFEAYIRSLSDVIDKYSYNRAIGLSVVTEGVPELGEIGMKAITSAKDRKKLASSTLSLSDIPAVYLDPAFNLGNPFTFQQIIGNSPLLSLSQETSTEANTALQEKISKYVDVVETNLISEISKRSSSFFAALSNLQELHEETSTCITQIELLREQLAAISNRITKKGLFLIRTKRRRQNYGSLHQAVKVVAEIRDTQPTIQVLLRQGDFLGSLDLITASTRGMATAFANAVESATRASPTIPNNANVKALQNYNLQLAEMTKLIGKMMQTEFVSAITSFFSDTTSIALDDGVVRSELIPDTYLVDLAAAKYSQNRNQVMKAHADKFIEVLKAKLTPLVFGLIRMDRLLEALGSAKDALIFEIKQVMKKNYPTYDFPMSPVPRSPMPGKSSNKTAFAEYLEDMNFTSFSAFLVQILSSTMVGIEVTKMVQNIINNCIKEAQSKGIVVGVNSTEEDPLSGLIIRVEDEDDELGSTDLLNKSYNQEVEESPKIQALSPAKDNSFGQFQVETSNLAFSVADFTHSKIAKILSLRAEQNSSVTPKDFYWMHGCLSSFMKLSDDLAERTCYSLKGTVLSQGKKFLKRFHESRSKLIALMVDSEQWNQAEVPYEFQIFARKISESSTAALEFLDSPTVDKFNTLSGSNEDLDMGLEQAAEEDMFALLQSSLNVPLEDRKSSKQLYVEGKRFYAVSCTLIFLKTLVEYLQCTNNIPGIVNEGLNRIMEILKLFNSKVCQLILGAGAMKSAGLKNITARHIALASQTIGIFIQLIPHIRTHLQSKLTEKQQFLLSDFDRVMKDYREHQNELYFKLVSIMNERLSVHSEKIKKIDWESESNEQSESPNEYIIQLVKETTTLHKVLWKYLGPETMKMILQTVFKNYVKQLEDEYNRLNIYSIGAKNRLLLDVQYLIKKLSSLEGVEGPGNSLEVTVNNMKIKDKRTAFPSIAQTSPAVSSSASDTEKTGGLFSGFKMSMSPGRPSTDSNKPAQAGEQKKGGLMSGLGFGKMMNSKN